MKVYVNVELPSGAYVNICGIDLTPEDVNDVFNMLSGHVVCSVPRKERTGPKAGPSL